MLFGGFLDAVFEGETIRGFGGRSSETLNICGLGVGGV